LGWNRDTKTYNKSRRVAIINQESYVVIIEVKSKKDAKFITAYIKLVFASLITTEKRKIANIVIFCYNELTQITFVNLFIEKRDKNNE